MPNNPRFQMKEMTPKEAAHFLRQVAETTAHASMNWDNFETIAEGMINSAMDAARKFGNNEK